MIEVPPADRAVLRDAFGCSRRLATRIGALLARGIAVSALVLEEARPGTRLETLLLRNEWLETEDPARTLGTLLAEEDLRSLASEMPLALVRQDGLTVIAAEEEEIAARAFAAHGAPLTPAADARSAEAGDDATEPDGVASLLPESRSANLPARGESEVEPEPAATPFSEQEVARLRVAVFAGATPQEKVAALRQFAFTPLAEEERVRVFLEAAGDEDPALRAVAPAGLRRMGLPADTADALRLLAEGEASERSLAAERLVDLARNGEGLELDAIVMGLIGALRDARTAPPELRAACAALAASAERLGAERLAREEVFRILLERLPRANPRLLLQIRRTLQALDALRPGWLTPLLVSEIADTGSTTYRALLLEIATALPLTPEQERTLITIAARTVPDVPADTDAARALLQFLTAAGEPGLLAIAERLPDADAPHQRQFVRVLDNALRTVTPEAETRRVLAEQTLAVLRESSRSVRLDILETIVCIRRDLPEELRERVTRAILSDFAHYAHWPHAQTLESALARLGPPAGRVLLETIQEESRNPLAAPLVRALGAIGKELGEAEPTTAEEEDGAALATDILRRLHALAFGAPPFLDDLHVALGRIASGRHLPAEAAALIRRTLLERVMGDRENAALIRALGWAVTGPGAEGQVLRSVADLALQHLLTPQPEPSFSREMQQGEEVFRVGGETDRFGRLIPACIDAVERLVVHPGTPESLGEELTERLIDIWERTSSYEVMWSPADVARLTESLGRIGAHDGTPDALRIRIAQTLRGRAVEFPVLDALSRILARADRLPELDRLAGAAVLGILRLLSASDRMRPEDRELYLRTLARIAGRGRLAVRGGKATRVFRRVIETLSAGVTQGVPGSLQLMVALREAGTLPEESREELARTIQRHTRLIRTGRA